MTYKYPLLNIINIQRSHIRRSPNSRLMPSETSLRLRAEPVAATAVTEAFLRLGNVRRGRETVEDEHLRMRHLRTEHLRNKGGICFLGPK